MSGEQAALTSFIIPKKKERVTHKFRGCYEYSENGIYKEIHSHRNNFISKPNSVVWIVYLS